MPQWHTCEHTKVCVASCLTAGLTASTSSHDSFNAYNTDTRSLAATSTKTRNSSGDDIANVNFFTTTSSTTQCRLFKDTVPLYSTQQNLYALSACGGYISVENESRLNKVLRKAKRYGWPWYESAKKLPRKRKCIFNRSAIVESIKPQLVTPKAQHRQCQSYKE